MLVAHQKPPSNEYRATSNKESNMLEFKIPEVGENIKTGTIVRIAVAEGDTVKKDQDLLEMETDKATVPIPSPCNGTIAKILIKEGDTVKIGQVVIKIEESGTAGTAAPAKEKQAQKEKAKEETKTSAPAPKAEAVVAAPRVTPREAVTRAFKSNEEIPAHQDVPAAPSVRRLARELGIDVIEVPGSGPGGRISKEDINAYAKQLIALYKSGAVASGIPTPTLPDFSKWGEVTREAMNNIRKKTATHLSYCWQTIPHVTQFDKADITELDKTRKKYSTDERKLTITPFLLKVMAVALKKFPQFNASIDMKTNEIIYKKYINLGIAVDTPRGLIVPVIRDIDKKNIFQITEDLVQMAERARNKKTTLEELQGGSMTLTNLGGVGGTMFTPIVNWPEVAILGVSRGGLEPVWEDNKFVPRLKLPLSLSYDHRLIDGADGARFIRFICEALEQPFIMEM